MLSRRRCHAHNSKRAVELCDPSASPCGRSHLGARNRTRGSDQTLSWEERNVFR